MTGQCDELVDLASCDVVLISEVEVQITLIVSEIKIRFASVLVSISMLVTIQS